MPGLLTGTYTRLWAVIVTIEYYAKNDLYPRAAGSTIDGNKTVEYLTDVLKVPFDQIRHLRDKQATRAAIISTFHTHLIENPKIQPGDAIYIHYSGHGGRVRAPDSWFVAWEDGRRDAAQFVEAIIPYDEGLPDEEHPGRSICSIPDRTIGAIVNKVADLYGDNITVVLDCCHSGDGTRALSIGDGLEVLAQRSIQVSSLTPLPSNIDNGLIHTPIHNAPSNGKKRFGSLAASHVLMAACGPKESAVGGEEGGGLFTRLWLKALCNEDIYPRTYCELLKVIDKEMARYRPHMTLQHPQCDGFVRKRLVFQETMMSSDCFEMYRTPGNLSRFYVTAGEVHGIKKGMMFEIHEKHPHPQSTPPAIAFATVVDVHSIISTVSIEDTSPLNLQSELLYLAFLPHHAETLTYTMRQDEPPSTTSRDAFDTLTTRLDCIPGFKGVLKGFENADEEANLDLQLGDNRRLIVQYPNPQAVQSIPSEVSRLTLPLQIQPVDFFQTLQRFVKFNKLLALQPRIDRRLFASNEVVLQLYAVEPRHNSDDTKDEVSWTITRIGNDETQVKKDSRHFIVLKNNFPSQDLYVQIWLFDPPTYTVQNCYKAPNPLDATLLANDVLAVDITDALSWRDTACLDRSEDSKTTDPMFFKAIVTDQPVDLDIYQQLGDEFPFSTSERVISRQVGLSKKGAMERSALERFGGEKNSKWDTLLLKVIRE